MTACKVSLTWSISGQGTLVVDGVDLSTKVARGPVITLPTEPDELPTVTVTLLVDALDVALDEAHVVTEATD